MAIKKHEEPNSFFKVEIRVAGPLDGDWPTLVCEGRFQERDEETGDLQPWLFYTPHQSRSFRIACSNAGTYKALIDELFDYENITEHELDVMESVAYKVSQIMAIMYESMCCAVHERDKKWNEKYSELLYQYAMSQTRRRVDASSDNQSNGYVYLIRHRNGLTKIGYSRNPRAREKTLQAEDPRLQMIHCFTGDMELEKKLHKAFSHLRKRGEWFELEQRHIDWILFFLRDKDNCHIVRECSEALAI